jgi:hypothetical protein
MSVGQLKRHFDLFRGYPEIPHNRRASLYMGYPQLHLDNLGVLFFLVA